MSFGGFSLYGWELITTFAKKKTQDILSPDLSQVISTVHSSKTGV